MPDQVIHVRGTRADVHRAIKLAIASASGASSAGGDAASALQVRLGMTALSLIKTAFVEKSRGGTDECGLSWPKLSPKTIAYSRRHPGAPARVRQSPSQRAALAPSAMLTDRQRKRWWSLYRSFLGKAPGGSAFHKFRPKGGEYFSHANAAKMAWKILKAEGAKTIIGEYGNTDVLILRNIGLLLNSLSPGVDPKNTRMPSTPPDVENQVFRVGRGEVIVGTNRKFAGAHHKGIPGRLPQRRLWAEPADWPDSWWDAISEQGKLGLIEIMLYVLRNLR